MGKLNTRRALDGHARRERARRLRARIKKQIEEANSEPKTLYEEIAVRVIEIEGQKRDDLLRRLVLDINPKKGKRNV